MRVNLFQQDETLEVRLTQNYTSLSDIRRREENWISKQ